MTKVSEDDRLAVLYRKDDRLKAVVFEIFILFFLLLGKPTSADTAGKVDVCRFKRCWKLRFLSDRVLLSPFFQSKDFIT